ncbi:putative cytochrome P450, partial [Aspergillus nomiae NRRL 13137]
MALLALKLTLAVVPLAILYALLFLGRREKHLPPGPPTVPIIGNAHLIPRKGAHFTFLELAKKYGGMFSLKIGSNTLIILSDRRIIKEVLDKNSSISSNRPDLSVAHTITGGDHLLFMDAGAEWRLFRRLLHQEFMSSRCDKVHIETQNAEAVQMLRDFIVYPDQYMLHAKRFSNSIIMSLLFGIRTPSFDTPHMQKLYHLMDHWSKIMEIGSTPPVDVFPFLQYIPERFLGNWKGRTAEVQQEMLGLYGEIVRHVMDRWKTAGSRGCFMDNVLDQNGKLGLNDHQLYFLGGVALEGGSDTSSSVINTCMHALVQWPEIQKKAQQEIDSVVDETRTPVWSDFANLPYVTQVVKEAQRWRPVGGLGIPHVLTEDQWVDGKLLPKGATVMTNVWELHHDEKRYANPDVFDPEHYAGYTKVAPEYLTASDPEARDHYAYGNGRRVCPGIHLGERNIFLGICKLLWAFEFHKAVDASGNPIETDINPTTAYSEGFITSANKFPCRIVPRSEKRKATIMREFADMERVFSKYET